MLRVTVNPIWAQKNLQIPEQMSDDEKNQDDARDCNGYFLSNGRAIESGENIHGRFGARQSMPHASDYERRLERQGRRALAHTSVFDYRYASWRNK